MSVFRGQSSVAFGTWAKPAYVFFFQQLGWPVPSQRNQTAGSDYREEKTLHERRARDARLPRGDL